MAVNFFRANIIHNTVNKYQSFSRHICVYNRYSRTWWRHQMETFSALLAHWVGNLPVTGEFPSQRPVTQSFGGFFDLRMSKRLSKQSRRWWFETLSRALWRHCNVNFVFSRACDFIIHCPSCNAVPSVGRINVLNFWVLHCNTFLAFYASHNYRLAVEKNWTCFVCLGILRTRDFDSGFIIQRLANNYASGNNTRRTYTILAPSKVLTQKL